MMGARTRANMVKNPILICLSVILIAFINFSSTRSFTTLGILLPITLLDTQILNTRPLALDPFIVHPLCGDNPNQRRLGASLGNAKLHIKSPGC